MGDSAEIAKSIVGLLKDEKQRQEMGRKGQEAVKVKFDWRRMSSILEEDYTMHINI